MLSLGLGLTSVVLRGGGAQSAAPFTPADLFANGEGGAWYNIQDPSTLFFDSAGTTLATVDGELGHIGDSSGNGNAAVQTSDKPELKQSGSVYWAQFNGDDDFLAPPTFGLAQDDFEGGVFISLRAAAATGYVLNAAGSNPSLSDHGFSLLAWSDGRLQFTLGGSANVASGMSGEDRVVYADWSRVTGEGVVNLDGTEQAASIGSASQTGTSLLIGKRDGGVFFQGRIYEIVILNRRSTAQERADIAAWMASRLP